MVNQELVVYIAQQLEAGISESDIRKSLMQGGWQETTVSEAFVFLQPIATQPPEVFQPEKNSNKTVVIFVVAVAILLLIVGVVYATNQLLHKSVEPVTSVQFASPEVPTVNQAQQNVIPTPGAQEQTIEKQLEQITKETLAVAMKISQNITSCTPTKLEFTHIFDGKKYIKEIVGKQEDKCYYTESMPNNGKMDCYFSDQQAGEIVEYTNKLSTSTTIKSSTHIDFASTQSNSQTTETLDGVEVINPWNNALQDGSCVVSGY